MKKTTLKNITLTAAVACMLAAPNAQAIDWVSGQVGDWSVGSNWDGGSLPTLSTLARFGSGAGAGDAGGEEASINGIAALADRFIIGQNTPNPTFTSKVYLNSGSLTTDSTTQHRIGQSSEGWLTVNGGTLDIQNAGYSSDAGGRLIVNGGDVNIGGISTVGGSSAGFLEVNGTGMTIDVTGNYNFGAFGTAIFTLDSTLAGVGVVNNSAILNLNATSTLTVDFRGYDFSANKGSDIVLFDYGTLGGVGADTFGTINFIGGFGELDYTTGGQIRLLSVVPEPSSTALLGLGGLALMLRRKRS